MIRKRWRILIDDILHHLLLIAAVLFFLIAVALSVLRLTLPLLAEHQALIASSLSSLVGSSVSFERMQVGWHKLQPEVDLTGVNIWDNDHRALMHIPEVNIRLSLFVSLLHRKFELSLLQIKNWRLQVYQDEQGKWQVAGIENLSADSHSNKNIALDDFLTTMLQIKHLQIQQSNFQIKPKDKFAFTLTNINIDWYAKNGKVAVYGNTLLQGPSVSKIQFAAKAQGNWAAGFTALSGELYLKLANADLTPWLAQQTLNNFSWQHGVVNGEVWADWQQDHWQQTAANLVVNNLNVHQVQQEHPWGFNTQQASVKINWQPQQFLFVLDSNQGMLSLSNIFRSTMPYENLAFMGQWQKDKNGFNQLKITSANIKTAEADLNAAMKLTWSTALPLDMTLMAKADFNTLKNISHYLPTGIMPPSVVKWLDESIKGGDGLQAQMLWRGPPKNFPFKDQTGTMQIEGGIQNATLDYAKGWPAITHLNAGLYFTSHGMHIIAHQGMLGNIPISEVSADIPQFQKQSELIIQSKLQTDLASAWQFLSQSKLKDTLSSLLTQINARGPVGLNLKIDLPLYDESNGTQYQGDLQLSNDQLNLVKLPIQINQLNGPLHFDNQTVQAKLAGQWLNQPWTFDISKQAKQNYLQLNAAGKAPVEQWVKQQFPFAGSWVSGDANVKANFQIGGDAAKTFVMKLSSDLKGLAIKLPLGLSKDKNATTGFFTELHATTNQELTLKTDWASPQGDVFIKNENTTWNLFTPKGNASISQSAGVNPIWEINLQNLDLKNLDDNFDNKFKLPDSFPAFALNLKLAESEKSD